MRALRFANECVDDVFGHKFMSAKVTRIEIVEAIRLAIIKYNKFAIPLIKEDAIKTQLNALLE